MSGVLKMDVGNMHFQSQLIFIADAQTGVSIKSKEGKMVSAIYKMYALDLLVRLYSYLAVSTSQQRKIYTSPWSVPKSIRLAGKARLLEIIDFLLISVGLKESAMTEKQQEIILTEMLISILSEASSTRKEDLFGAKIAFVVGYTRNIEWIKYFSQQQGLTLPGLVPRYNMDKGVWEFLKVEITPQKDTIFTPHLRNSNSELSATSIFAQLSGKFNLDPKKDEDAFTITVAPALLRELTEEAVKTFLKGGK